MRSMKSINNKGAAMEDQYTTEQLIQFRDDSATRLAASVLNDELNRGEAAMLNYMNGVVAQRLAAEQGAS